MKRFLTIILAIFACGNVFGQIHEVYSLDKIIEEFQTADENTLVVFDVDFTLIVPKDTILRPCGEKLFMEYLKKVHSKLGTEQTDYLTSKCMLQIQTELVNPLLPEIIEFLQQKNIKTIALTALRPGSLGVIPSLEDWRYQDLKGKGFDFSQAFPEYPYLRFNFFNENDLDYQATFKDGILYSGKIPKGQVLSAFSKMIGWTPSKVIFIDDRIHFIESVEKEMSEMGIETCCFYYREAECLPCGIDEEIADFQFRHLLEKHVWLSDEVARTIINRIRFRQ